MAALLLGRGNELMELRRGDDEDDIDVRELYGADEQNSEAKHKQRRSQLSKKQTINVELDQDVDVMVNKFEISVDPDDDKTALAVFHITDAQENDFLHDIRSFFIE